MSNFPSFNVSYFCFILLLTCFYKPFIVPCYTFFSIIIMVSVHVRDLLGLGPEEKLTLQPGGVIQYYNLVFVFGNPVGHSKNLHVDPESFTLLKL